MFVSFFTYIKGLLCFVLLDYFIQQACKQLQLVFLETLEFWCVGVRIKNAFQKIEHIKRIFKDWVDEEIGRKRDGEKEEGEEVAKHENIRQIYCQ